MFADPKKQLDLLGKISYSIIYNDFELLTFAENISDNDIPKLYPEFLPKAEFVIKDFGDNFSFEDYRDHVRKEPVEVRYLIYIRFFEAQQRLAAETKCPCEYPDTLREFL